MIDLYTSPTSNGLRPKMMLDEIGIDYQLHPIDVAGGESRSETFRELNPMATVPVIVDHNGPGGDMVTLTQSAAILIYLAQKSGKLLPGNYETDYLFLERYMNAVTDMGPTLSALFCIMRMENPHQLSQQMFEERFSEYLAVWNDILSVDQFCYGGELSIVDIALYPIVYRCQVMAPVVTQCYDNVDRWANELADRPGIIQAKRFGGGTFTGGTNTGQN